MNQNLCLFFHGGKSNVFLHPSTIFTAALLFDLKDDDTCTSLMAWSDLVSLANLVLNLDQCEGMQEQL